MCYAHALKRGAVPFALRIMARCVVVDLLVVSVLCALLVITNEGTLVELALCIQDYSLCSR